MTNLLPAHGFRRGFVIRPVCWATAFSVVVFVAAKLPEDLGLIVTGLGFGLSYWGVTASLGWGGGTWVIAAVAGAAIGCFAFASFLGVCVGAYFAPVAVGNLALSACLFVIDSWGRSSFTWRRLRLYLAAGVTASAVFSMATLLDWTLDAPRLFLASYVVAGYVYLQISVVAHGAVFHEASRPPSTRPA